jgi:hypothetical protein
MKRLYGFCGLFAAVFFLAVATPAHAQATRTWVSGVGDDANPCSRTAPCKTFAGAISKTAINGEINCLDPGGFGQVTITKSITIDCSGTIGGVLTSAGSGMLINGANVVVNIRNVIIDGAGFGANGIRVLNAGAVNIDGVVIENFTGSGASGNGIIVDANAANTRVTVSNTHIVNVAGNGILTAPTGVGAVVLNVDNTQITGPGVNGIDVRNGTNGMVNRTTIVGWTGAGMLLEQSTATVYMSNSLVAHNGNGIQNGLGAGQAPNTILYGNVITSNSINGLLINGGLIFTYGNNGIRGNTGNEAPNQASMGTQ